MIPFADCINHHNVDSTYELIHPGYHLSQDRQGPSSYYSQSKMEGDYTDLLKGYQSDTEEDVTAATIGGEGPFKVKRLLPRTLTQIKKIYKREDVLKWTIQEVAGSPSKEIWDADYMTTSDEEDNDSEPEERLEEAPEGK